MDTIIAFIIFTGVMVVSVFKDWLLIFPLSIGLICFFVVAIRRGFRFQEVLKFAEDGAKDAFIVVQVMFIIGMITAMWRSSGTITYFVYYGAKIIQPSFFILLTFLLSCFMAYALGTSFGVAGTLGLIFMALARSGGVSPIVTAGTLMSGIYFGDRTGPASSSANMVAAITKTDLYGNINLMIRTAILPMILSTIFYVFLSFRHPISHVDEEILSDFATAFHISWVAVIPAVFMLLLPALKVDVRISILVSVVASFILTVTVQDVAVTDAVRYLVFGFECENADLGKIMDGGGIISMLEICGIVILSCSYAGIFNGTGMLDAIDKLLEKLIDKTGRFATMFITSIATTAVFSNQTIASLMCSNLLTEPYKNEGASKKELAIDIENSCIIISPIIPWCIAFTVPARMMGVGYSCMAYAATIYLIPLCYAFTKKRWFPERRDDG